MTGIMMCDINQFYYLNFTHFIDISIISKIMTVEYIYPNVNNKLK